MASRPRNPRNRKILSVKEGETCYSLICGIGVADTQDKQTHLYRVWKKLIQRCYSPTAQRDFPYYAGCVVNDSWHRYSRFLAWAESRYRDGDELDKDLLILGNKEYGPDTCVFLPKFVNILIQDARSRKRDLPPGVYANKKHKDKPYWASYAGRHLGSFHSSEDAHYAYREARSSAILNIARDYPDPTIRAALRKRAYDYGGML